MRHQLLGFLLVMATAPAAFADGEGSAKTDLKYAPATATVQRDTGQKEKGFKSVELKMASVADVDLNGDGHISFDELFRFDVAKDF